MLEELKIKNFALIKAISIKFSRGLNILTGETGAGKSIIIDALSAILGEKMTIGHIRSGEKKATIEGVFLLEPNTTLEELLDNMGIELEGRYLYLRRELNNDGKGRSFLNGVMVPASKLKEVGNLLVDIHGQNEHQAIMKIANHILILDTFGEDHSLPARRREIATIFNQVKEYSEILSNLELSNREKEAKKELLNFAVDEIQKAELKAGEDEELHKESKKLAGSEKLVQDLHLANDYLKGYDENPGVLDQLEKVERVLISAAETDTELLSVQSQVQEALYIVEESANILRNYVDSFDFSRERLEEVQTRLDLISKLVKKYRVANVGKLLDYQDKANKELESINLSNVAIAKTRQKLAGSLALYTKKAADLSNLRYEVSSLLETKINEELKDLVMENTRFKVNLTRIPEESSKIVINNKKLKYSKNGIDHVEFFISAGKEETLRPLRKIASGGEMSRLMLALKKLIIDNAEPQSMVFDEVDAGIGGKVAERVGKKLKSLSEKAQTICITHLPQIASLANIQFKVVKIVDENKRVLTGIKRLTNKERILEIARMMAGEQITDLTIKHASEMLKLSLNKEGPF